MNSKIANVIYEANSIVSIETHPEHAHPVVIKKPSSSHPPPASLFYLWKDTARSLQRLPDDFQLERFQKLLGDVI
jgi:hypothetical protein